MQLPVTFLDSLTGIQGFDKESFIRVHESGGQVTSVRFNPSKYQAVGHTLTSSASLPIASPVPWSSFGFYLTHRPSFIFDPLLHAGQYYVQEASGMFLEQAIRQTTDLSASLNVLDLCAAPGGKSTLLQSVINKDSLLVSNEVIKTRAAILEENMTKWGEPNVIISNNDPADFAALENFFDAIVVDAPCSGSGLFRREPEAISEWSGKHVQLCWQRQQRILADVYPALRQQGTLIYCTCSYSREEDEDILDWMTENFFVDSLPLTIDSSWNIVEVRSAKHGAVGYRFFPDKLKGEGFFIACLRKKDGGEAVIKSPKKTALQKSSRAELGAIQPWLKPDAALQLWKQGEWLMAFPAGKEKELCLLADKLYLRRAGITVGKLAGTALIPDHALAVSSIVNNEITGIALSKEESLQYLRKEDVKINSTHKGWALMRYEQQPLGWVKVLANRVNNYYPKEWRILKSI